MKIYDSYKDSDIEWIGEIPSHWEVERLKHCYKFVNKRSEMEFPKIGLEHIESWTGRLIENDSEFEGEGTLFKNGDILFGKLRPYLAKVYLANFSGKAVGDFFVFRPDSSIYPKFGHKFMLSRNFIEITNSSTFGSKMPRVSPDFINELKTIVPPIPEQTAIASYLDRKTAEIDELIADKKRLLELYEEEKTAIINELVTGKKVWNGHSWTEPDEAKDSGIEWLGEIPEHWEVKRLKHITNKMISGPFGSSLKKEIYSESGYKIYGQEQVIKNEISYGNYYIPKKKFDEMSNYRVAKNDILISCVGTFGKILMVPEVFEEGIINPRLIKVSPSKMINSKYLTEVLKSSLIFEQFSSVSRGGTMGVINLDLLNQLIIPTPLIDEQPIILSKIETECAKIDTKKTKTQKLIALLTEYRTALISEVVTGKVKVVD
ncbi:restriction endonuclease subunit S [Pleomorphovibrio marinus]|uniref:restriction endonuclease subunit S n=1 Tax=Pleomorphovibrio marinus TaxID=2164132 RepID=UPI000E0A36F8|nr:restriction endonuclease subunit S [Pleomorphovibrio marinus]